MSRNSEDRLSSWVSDIEDPVKFMKAMLTVSRDGQILPFNPYKYQEALIYDNTEKKITNKSRQTGISTITVAKKLHKAIMARPQDDYLCIFISLRQDQANELIYKAKGMLNSMREPWTVPLSKSQEGVIQIKDNGARLMALSAHESAGRGWRADLVLDEFAHVPNDDQILKAALSTSVREGGQVDMISTPYGDRGEFAKIAQACKARDMGEANAKQLKEAGTWSLHEIHWQDCPDLHEERIMERCFSDEMYQQEYCLQFLDEATAMLPWEILMKATKPSMKLYSLHKPISNNGAYRYIGIDPGTKVNETGIVLAEQLNDHWKLRYIDAEKRTKDDLIEYVMRWKRHFKPNRIYVDETGMGAPITADLKKFLGSWLVEGITLSTQMKEKLVYNMVGLFEANQISIPDNEYLKEQLHALERSKTPVKGLSRFTGKVKGRQDDLIWGTALAVCDGLFKIPPLRADVSGFRPRTKRRIKYGK